MKEMFFVVMLLGVTNSIYAQNKENTVEVYRNQIFQKIDNYKSSIDKKYSDYLRNIWEKYTAFAPVDLPKEDILPVIYDEADTSILKELTIDRDEILSIKDFEEEYQQSWMLEQVEDECLPEVTPKITPAILDENIDNSKVSLTFYNIPVHATIFDINIDLSILSNETIADAWDSLSESTQLDKTLSECLCIQEELNLCDWAYMDLVNKISRSFYVEENKITLLSAFLLHESGYDIKIGRAQGQLFLLFSSISQLYNHFYFTINDVCYYPYAFGENLNGIAQMEICDTPHNNSRPISLLIEKEQKFNVAPLQERKLSFSNASEIKVPINQNLLDFYSTYPTSRIGGNDMTRWAMYAQTPLNATTREELYNQLTPLIIGKSELEAANILLNFVQTSFIYKYDDEVWGEDRAFFAEESLAYPYCDCEDCSILFSHIIRDLLDLKVALVYSPGHLFTAVQFTDSVNGSYISINDEKYVICEPTCTTGAPVGWYSNDGVSGDVQTILLSKINYEKSYKVSLGNTEYKRSLFPVCIHGKYGYLNKDGKIVVPCEYDSLIDSPRGDKFLYGAVSHNKLSLFDYSGWEVLRNAEGYIPLELNHLKDGVKEDFFAIVKFEGEWYYVHLPAGPLEGDFCFNEYYMEDVSYENNIYCKPQSENKETTDKFIILKMKSNNKYGVLNLNSMTCIIPFEYDEITFVDNDKSKVRVYNSKTNEYKMVSLCKTEYKRSLFPICINGKYGYKNAAGEIVVPCEYDSLIDSEQGDNFFYGAVASNEISLFDFNGRCYVSDIEDYIPLEIHTIFDDGYIGDYCAIVKEQGKWYFKDLNSRDPSMFFYEFCLDEYYMNDVTFENNIYCEPQGENKSATGKYIILKKKSNNKYGVLLLHNYFIDSGYKIYIPFEYDKITFVDNDKSKVRVYVSKTDEYKMVSLCKTEYKRSLFPVCINGKYGYQNAAGEIVVPCEYDSLIDSEQGDNFFYGAVASNEISLFYYDGVRHVSGIEANIPLVLNTALGGKCDFFAISKCKFDGEWYFYNVITGILPSSFSFSDYDMTGITYDKNIYCVPQTEKKEVTDKFIILKKKSTGKYGVLKFISEECVIPFEYDEISFMEGDKSKVKVYNSKTNEYKIISLK